MGQVSVLLLQEPFAFAREDHILRFPLDAARVLNVGTTAKAIVIAALQEAENISDSPLLDKGSLGQGDLQFLKAIEELPLDLEHAGLRLLLKVRAQFPGDLRSLPGGRRFQETPDNFWFLTVQPRDRSLAINVRGLPDRFPVNRLKIVKDRRPYSRFKVTSDAEVDEAVAVIVSAVRRNG